MKKIILFSLLLTSFLLYSQTGVRKVVINNPAAIVIEGTEKAASGFGENNGRIESFAITGGTLLNNASYTQVWTKDGAQFTPTDFNKLYAGTYIVTVTDSKNCSLSKTFTIGQPQKLEVLISGNKIACFGGTGSLVASVSGGTVNLGYSYVWQKKEGAIYNTVFGKSDSNPNGLDTGIYRVVVTDNASPANTTISEDFFLDQNTQLTAIPNLTNVNCRGGNNGMVSLTLGGGTGAYNVQWTNGPVGATRTNLVAGIYQYTVTDANVAGCSIVGSVQVTEPSTSLTVNPSITQTQPSTPTTFDGKIKVSGTGGTPGYTYAWYKGNTLINPDPDQDGEAVGLDNGTYHVIITDANNCSVTSADMVLNALAIAIDAHTDIKCFGESTGNITARAFGGLGSGYTYKWYKINGGSETAIGITAATISNIPYGTYRVRVNEGQTPSAYIDYTLTQPTAPLNVTYTKADPSCFGGNNGNIILDVSGGTVGSGYTYLWSNGSTAKDQTALTAGTYSVTVNDANNCPFTISGIVLGQPTPITIPAPSITNVSIYGQSTGAITLNPITGGTPNNGNYTYNWTYDKDNTFSRTTKDISGLKAGKYTLAVTDSKSCIATQTYTITENPELIVSINETKSILCNGDTNGEITATVNGGVANYIYKWYKNGVLIAGNTNVLPNLGFGKYKLIVTDNVNATKESNELDLVQPSILTVALTSTTPVLCYGNATGAININASGGTTPYTFAWKKDNADYANTENLTGLTAAIYSLVVTDKNGCSVALNNIAITQPVAPLAIIDVQVKNLTGFETKNGVIEVNITGGTTNYTYAWRVKGTTPVIGTSKLLDQLAIGTYVLTVTDQSNCTITKEYTLIQPPRLDITGITMTPNTQVKCFGDTTAELTATITGGVPAYIYKWYNASAPTVVLSTTNKVSNLGAGKYIVSVTDQNNNVLYGVNEFTVTQPNPLAIANTKTEVSCKNGNDGTINLTINGGSSDYNIVWNYNSTVNNGKTNISNLPAGTYTVTVSDRNAVNCSISQTITISEPANELAIASDEVKNATGFGLSNGKISVQISGGTSNYSYKWFKNNVEINGQTTAVLNNQPAGSYKLVVTDSKNCTLEKTFTITEPLELKVTVSVAKTIDCFGSTGILRAKAVTGTGVPDAQGFYTYKWFRENGTLINTTLNAEATTGNIPTGKYYVTVIDSNNNQTTSSLFEITQPTQIIVTTANKQDVTCYDGYDGVVEINVTGGTPDIVAGAPVYTYLWSNGSTDKNQYSLRKGTYSVSVYDGNLCIGTLNNIVINQPQDFGFDLDKIVPTIPTAGNSDGALHIEIVGGVAPYRYVCRDSNGTIIKDVPNSNLKQVDFTNLASSIFTVSATDATGCTKSTEFDFNNNVLEISISQSAEITCNNGKNGAITAAVKGGFGIRTISWYKNGVKIPNESNALLSNLEIGTYYAVVKDFNKVEVTSQSIVITQPDPIAVTYTQKNVNCLGFNDGTITLTASGGSNLFQYRYKSQDSNYGNWIAFNNLTAVIPNLKANTYDIQVQDSKGCNYTSIVNVEITEPKQLVITQNTITPATGFGLYNGSINIVVQGGTQAYNYKWFTSSNIQVNGTTATVADLSAGKYYAIVTDAQGCTITSELYEITQPDLLVATITSVSSVLCNGDKNASIKANVTGGIAGYTYKWHSVPDTGVLGTNVTLGNLGIGTYYVEVTDTKNNISKSELFVINEPQKLNNTLSADYTLCGDGNDWTITPSAIGGTKPYTYLWNTGATTEVLKNAVPGTYSLTVTDFNGCTITKSISFIAPPHLDASETIKMPTCYLGSDAKIVVTPIAGTAPYTYLWNTGEKTNTLSNAPAGAYSIEITDSRGCKILRSYTVVDPPKDVIYLGEDVTLCYKQSLTINGTVDDDKATYAWASDKGFKSTNPIITVSEPANYTLTVTNKLGCQATDTINISSQESDISAEFIMSSQVFVNEKFIIVDVSNPKADKIEWKLPSEAIVTNNNGDYAEMSFPKAGEYDITINTEKGRCTASQTKTIIVTEGEYVDPDNTDLQKKFDIKLYPNPSNGIFTVDATLDKVMSASVKVYNLNNNVVIDSKSGTGKDAYSFNFSLNGLSAGIYFVLFESQQGTKLRKLIIQ
ncbi:T9SS type A sorting domain-containing protein [Flavobacterium sp. HBTb2-11-1]|uniref:T9SS type A sorting domain-containing protein n=1 Tax=Flavobacterium sp. HBTb2-11-1 TaxID=2692212 RepID=UPI00136B6A7F|nr:T9SS type A sorting domain-containing protein [Flavobacterium sp. HBTb2-11-1]MXO05715.1 T9SS type A sorting domain-containing protein [Flavobacterium sp. HBTb2-11-1]